MILAGQCKRSFTCLKQVERYLCGQFLGCRIGMIESLILFIFFGLSGSTPEQSHQGVLILSQVSLMFSSVIAWPSNVSSFLETKVYFKSERPVMRSRVLVSST